MSATTENLQSPVTKKLGIFAAPPKPPTDVFVTFGEAQSGAIIYARLPVYDILDGAPAGIGEAIARANLIAAAHDLRDILDLLVSLYADDIEAYPAGAAHLTAARAAIAKAEGRS